MHEFQVADGTVAVYAGLRHNASQARRSQALNAHGREQGAKSLVSSIPLGDSGESGFGGDRGASTGSVVPDVRHRNLGMARSGTMRLALSLLQLNQHAATCRRAMQRTARQSVRASCPWRGVAPPSFFEAAARRHSSHAQRLTVCAARSAPPPRPPRALEVTFVATPGKPLTAPCKLT